MCRQVRCWTRLFDRPRLRKLSFSSPRRVKRSADSMCAIRDVLLLSFASPTPTPPKPVKSPSFPLPELDETSSPDDRTLARLRKLLALYLLADSSVLTRWSVSPSPFFFRILTDSALLLPRPTLSNVVDVLDKVELIALPSRVLRPSVVCKSSSPPSSFPSFTDEFINDSAGVCERW